jgi:hypothetical protein
VWSHGLALKRDALLELGKGMRGVREEVLVYRIQDTDIPHVNGHLAARAAMITGQLDAVGLRVFPIPGAFLMTLQHIVPVSHQVRMTGDEGMIHIPRCQSDVIECELDDVVRFLAAFFRPHGISSHHESLTNAA